MTITEVTAFLMSFTHCNLSHQNAMTSFLARYMLSDVSFLIIEIGGPILKWMKMDEKRAVENIFRDHSNIYIAHEEMRGKNCGDNGQVTFHNFLLLSVERTITRS